MKKHIDDKVLSLPPYVSTAWENVKALYLKGNDLIVDLLDGTAISVPGLSDEEIEEIFNFHAVYVEKTHDAETLEDDLGFMQGSGGESPFRFAINSLDGISSAMEHNPQQANMPPLPQEVLNKIGHIARIISPEEVQSLSPPVDGCNCFYCQITRAITGEQPAEKIESGNEFEEEVSDEELKFSEWAVSEIEDQLYLVTNKLDPSEQYKVFLGEPIGCTCGEPHCEHIIAVLKS